MARVILTQIAVSRGAIERAQMAKRFERGLETMPSSDSLLLRYGEGAKVSDLKRRELISRLDLIEYNLMGQIRAWMELKAELIASQMED